MNRLTSAAVSAPVAVEGTVTEPPPVPRGACSRDGLRRGAVWALASLLAAACLVLIVGCGGDAEPAGEGGFEGTAGASRADGSRRACIENAEWAPGEMSGAAAPVASPAIAAPILAPRSLPELWGSDGRARITLPEDWPADPAARWSGQRYATHEQLAHELNAAGPFAVVIDADDAAAVEAGLRYAEQVSAFAGGKELLGIFVRSRHPALAAHLAERLTAEQGWASVFVVF
jgi:hypothetical protein